MSLICTIVTAIWCSWFELKLNIKNNHDGQVIDVLNTCNYTDNTNSISIKTWINYNVTESVIKSIFDEYHENGNSVYNPPATDSFSTSGMSISARFMICVTISYLLSIFLWQPIIIAIKSLIKTIKLSNNRDLLIQQLLFYQELLGNEQSQPTKQISYPVQDTGDEPYDRERRVSNSGSQSAAVNIIFAQKLQVQEKNVADNCSKQFEEQFEE